MHNRALSCQCRKGKLPDNCSTSHTWTRKFH